MSPYGRTGAADDPALELHGSDQGREGRPVHNDCCDLFRDPVESFLGPSDRSGHGTPPPLLGPVHERATGDQSVQGDSSPGCLTARDLLCRPGQQVVIAAESQGCADIGLCYPPTVQRVTVPIPEASVVPSKSSEPAKKLWFN